LWAGHAQCDCGRGAQTGLGRQRDGASRKSIELGLRRLPQPRADLDHPRFRQPDRHAAILLLCHPAAPAAAVLPGVADGNAGRDVVSGPAPGSGDHVDGQHWPLCASGLHQPVWPDRRLGHAGYGNVDQHVAALLRHVQHRPATAALADCAGALNPQPSTLRYSMSPKAASKNCSRMQLKNLTPMKTTITSGSNPLSTPFRRRVGPALLTLLAALALAIAVPAHAGTQPAAIPISDIGVRATANYQGDALGVTATSDGARLGCGFQKLDGHATPEGLWLESTRPGGAGRLRLVAVAVSRGNLSTLNPQPSTVL